MNTERYKMALERGGAAIKRKTGFLCRRSSTPFSPVDDDMYVSMTRTKTKSGAPVMNVRIREEVADAYGIKIGEYITVEYDASPDGVMFIVRKATPSEGLKVYRCANERGVRSSFRLFADDVANLFGGDRMNYSCELKHHDSESGAFVFEEMK